MLRDEYKHLSVPEKILLVEEIWDSIAQDARLELSAGHKTLLAKREKDILDGTVKTKTWAEIKGNLKRKKK